MLAGLGLAAGALGSSGCVSGLAKGVTQGVLESRSKAERPDERRCYVQGAAFDGLEAYMRRQERIADEGGEGPVLKVLMVHGIGSHEPGYATRLAENLARLLSLSRVEARFREFRLASGNLPDAELGSLRVRRFLSRDDRREMLFYELTWDSIVEEEKHDIDFDNSGDYSFRRTPLNNTMKRFVNETVPDVMMYQGSSGEPIRISVGTALCFMFSYDWASLPQGDTQLCAPDRDEADERFLRYTADDYAFITHSLGSRVMTDSLQSIAQQLGEVDDPLVLERMRGIRGRRIPVFMLSNQLPLLQLGQPLPEVAGAIDAICSPGAPRRAERLFDEVALIAFSDPNDLLSYALPAGYIEKHLDSRMCPTVVNVIVNVAQIINVAGLTQLANPATAHLAYENDERVLSLITGGIGSPDTAPIVEERCEWIELF